jgi:hypothetical protein
MSTDPFDLSHWPPLKALEACLIDRASGPHAQEFLGSDELLQQVFDAITMLTGDLDLVGSQLRAVEKLLPLPEGELQETQEWAGLRITARHLLQLATSVNVPVAAVLADLFAGQSAAEIQGRIVERGWTGETEPEPRQPLVARLMSFKGEWHRILLTPRQEGLVHEWRLLIRTTNCLTAISEVIALLLDRMAGHGLPAD